MNPDGPDPVASTADHDGRRLALLRSIAEFGGRIVPQADPLGRHGYRYPPPGDGAERDLAALAGRDYLEERFFDRVSLCPKCAGHHLNVREVCGGCRRAHLAKEGLLHHFRCGYSGLAAEFPPADDGSRTCPKCARRMFHLGTEYDRLGSAFVCRECGLVSENPPVEAVCLACGTRTPAEDLVAVDVWAYVLTAQGHAALRRGSLAASDDEFVVIAGAPVYPRRLLLEFLDCEVKRLAAFDARFSVLLIESEAAALGDNGGSPPIWLPTLRRHLREFDLLGQLTLSSWLAILPQTRQRAAAAVTRQILAALGSPPPCEIAVVEITGRPDLARVLARSPLDAAV